MSLDELFDTLETSVSKALFHQDGDAYRAIRQVGEAIHRLGGMNALDAAWHHVDAAIACEWRPAARQLLSDAFMGRTWGQTCQKRAS